MNFFTLSSSFTGKFVYIANKHINVIINSSCNLYYFMLDFMTDNSNSVRTKSFLYSLYYSS